jgi:hypothetical protein
VFLPTQMYVKYIQCMDLKNCNSLKDIYLNWKETSFYWWNDSRGLWFGWLTNFQTALAIEEASTHFTDDWPTENDPSLEVF